MSLVKVSGILGLEITTWFKFYGEHSTNEETIKLFDKGHEWAVRLRGNNTLFSTLERPVMG